MDSMLVFIKHRILIYSSAPAVNEKTLKTFILQSTLVKIALELEWDGGCLFVCLCAILTVCTEISIVRTICGLNMEFQTVG